MGQDHKDVVEPEKDLKFKVNLLFLTGGWGVEPFLH